MTTPSLRSLLAPKGPFRVGVNYGNPVLVKRDAVSGELSGVAVELALELGRRLGVLVELVPFPSAGKLFEGVKVGAWDAAFLAIDPARAAEVDFTPPYVEIEGTYLVPPASPISNNGEVDRPGVRVGVSANSAYDLYLSRELKYAELVRGANPNEAFTLIQTGQVDVVAGVRQHLLAHAAELPGARVFEERFMAIEQALGIPKGRDGALAFLRQFIEEAKSSGLVARAIRNAGVTGVSVAPPA